VPPYLHPPHRAGEERAGGADGSGEREFARADTASLAGTSEAPAGEKKAARGSGRRGGASELRRALRPGRVTKKLNLEDGWLRPGCEARMFAAGANNTVRIAGKLVDYTAKRLEKSEVSQCGRRALRLSLCTR
jgi:hypothetical protein